MTQNSDGTFDLNFKDQKVYHYDSQGRLASMTDKNGNSLTLTYNTENQVQTVTGPAGRTLSFTYTTNGKIDSITDPLSRTVQFGYDGDEQLTTATNKRGHSTTYTYDINGITSITDPEGHTFIENVFDQRSRVIKQYDANGSVATFRYDDANQKTTFTDYNGNTTIYTFNDHYRVTSKTDAKGNKVTFTFDNDMNQTSVTDKNGNTTQYTFDDRSNVLTTTMPDTDGDTTNDTTEMVYNTDNTIDYKIDAKGYKTDYTYDTNGNLIEQKRTKADGSIVKTSYTNNSYGQWLTVTDTEGNTSTFTYDSHGDLDTETDALGFVTDYTFDNAGRMTEKVSPKGSLSGAVKENWTTHFVYDDEDNLIKVIDPNDQVTTYTYDKNNKKLSETDPLGRTTTYKYDGNGRVIEKTIEKSATETLTTTYERDPNGNVIRITDPKGNITRKVYDGLDQLTAVVNPLLNATSYTYDPNGNQKTISDQSTATISDDVITSFYVDYDVYYKHSFYVEAWYNDQWNIVFQASMDQDTKWVDLTAEQPATKLRTRYTTTTYAETSAYGEVTRVKTKDQIYEQATTGDLRLEYQGVNQDTYSAPWKPDEVVTITEGPVVKEFLYDERNQKSKTIEYIDGGERSKSFVYDTLGNVLTATDGIGQTTSYQYDQFSRLTKVTNPKGNVTEYQYDNVGNRTKVINAKGNITTYTYDAVNQQVTETDPLQNTTEYEYDGNGNLDIKIDSKGQIIDYQYDRLDQLTKKVYSDGTSVTYTYDAAGNRLSMLDGTGETVYTYTHRGQLESVTDPNGREVSYTYDDNGNLKTLTYPDATTVTYAYNKADQMVSVTDWNGKVTQIDPDPRGLTDQKTLPNGVTTNYTYNSLGEVKTIKSALDQTVLSERSYTYDANGNRKSMTDGILGETSYTYDALNQLTDVTYPDLETISYSYDANGNRKSLTNRNGTTSYTYNDADQLTTEGSTAYSYDANGNQTGKGTNTYSYDSENRLTQVTIKENGQTIDYTYNGDGEKVAKTVNGEIIEYVYDQGLSLSRLLVEYDGTGSISTKYIYGKELIAKENADGSIFYYLNDALGSTIALTDRLGDVVARLQYDAFGKIRSKSGTEDTNMQFTGEQREAEADLIYLRARYYDPNTGRFITKDTFKGFKDDPISQNNYIYAYNNPVTLIDPSGHSPKEGSSSLWSDLLTPVVGLVSSNHVETVGNGILEGIPKLAKYSWAVPIAGNGIGIVTDHFIGGQSWTSASLDAVAVSGATGATMAAFGVSTGGAGFALAAIYTSGNVVVEGITDKTTGQHLEDSVVKPLKREIKDVGREAKDIYNNYFDFSKRETFFHWLY
nr:RHS repeat-associated core domain-containing protein [Alkalihalobacillus sp. AL-G]